MRVASKFTSKNRSAERQALFQGMVALALMSSVVCGQERAIDRGKPAYEFGPTCGLELTGESETGARGDAFVLRVSRALPRAPLSLLLSAEQAPKLATSDGACSLLVGRAVHVALFANDEGRARYEFPMRRVPSALFAQAAAIDVEAGQGALMSNGVTLRSKANSKSGRFGPTACPGVCTGKIMIVGCDDRVEGPKTNVANKSPWNMVGRFSNGCSGTLIGDRWVLTAAHCFYNGTVWSGVVNQPIGFCLGQYSKTGKPFGTHYVDQIFVPFGYGKAGHSLQQNKAYDYALVRLKTPIAGGKTMEMRWFSWWLRLRKKHATAIGYPYDFGESNPAKQETAWYSKGVFPPSQPWKGIFGLDAGLLRTTIDAAGGMSGGPVYVWHNNKRYLTAVMIGSPKSECQQGYVWATRIMPDTIQQIQDRMAGKFSFFWRFRNVPTPLVGGGGIGGGFGG